MFLKLKRASEIRHKIERICQNAKKIPTALGGRAISSPGVKILVTQYNNYYYTHKYLCLPKEHFQNCSRVAEDK